MFRKSSNNGWIPPLGLNQSAVTTIGGTDWTNFQRFPGSLGSILVLNNSDALKNSNVNGSGGGTLYEGVYQLVKFSEAMVKGQIVFWDTLANGGLANYAVVATPSATLPFAAGVCLFTDASASGRYGYIQVAGLANCLYGASSTATLGLTVVRGSATDTPLLTVGTVVTVADGTAWTSTFQKAIVGIAYETPSATNIKRVLLNQAGFYPNVCS